MKIQLTQPQWRLLGGIGILVLSLFWLFLARGSAPIQVPPIVKVAPVKCQDMVHQLNLIGSVTASESVAIKSRLDSQIMEVFIKDGAVVKKGDRLFQLDDRDLKAQLLQSEAVLKSNEAEIIRAQKKYERDTELAKRGVAAKEQLDQSTQTYLAAQASLAATQARITQLKTQIDYANIRSPIDGVAGTIAITLGNVVKVNDTASLVVINKVDPIYVDIALPQRYFSTVQANFKKLKVDIYNSEGQLLKVGSIAAIQNTLDVEARTLILRAQLDNADHKLWPGMYVDVVLGIQKVKQALVAPMKAIMRTQKGSQVYQVIESKVALKPVTVKFATATEAVVDGDLKAGDELITDGGFNVKAGMMVKISKDDKR
ncbi:efflux RND transporter periplasmic adaptor subunit [Candidatus Odyssella thessalonicensis]|uniref:efflux RND transporter periplasmic adaptor subunit n=1 Tax=Candidatus Odyssella thessalonicensis TaxID=84647 RepID=UPI000225A905|nr:efflux RND transporter periplasmic adaptor subunit [Candidatus Odyssella thessalonicensis]